MVTGKNLSIQFKRATLWHSKMSAAAEAISSAFAKKVDVWRIQRQHWHDTHLGDNIYADPPPGEPASIRPCFAGLTYVVEISTASIRKALAEEDAASLEPQLAKMTPLQFIKIGISLEARL
jgi:hypothetical protein